MSFAGCIKVDSPVNTYTINGFNDVYLTQYTDTTFTLNMSALYLTGPHEQVTISVDSLPAGVIALTDTVVGTPDFNASISFNAHMLYVGTFRVIVLAKSPSTGYKAFGFRIHVAPGILFQYGFYASVSINVPRNVDTFINIPVNVYYEQGRDEVIKIKQGINDHGFDITPDSVSGLPPFSTNFRLHVPDTLAPGYYNFQFRTSSPSTYPWNYGYTFTVF